jgi:hypothetical protein
MQITKRITALKIEEYLQHSIDLHGLVDWAENAMMEGVFDPDDADILGTVISRLGVADIQPFGLTWEDCEELLRILGYSAHVSVITV